MLCCLRVGTESIFLLVTSISRSFNNRRRSQHAAAQSVKQPDGYNNNRSNGDDGHVSNNNVGCDRSDDDSFNVHESFDSRRGLDADYINYTSAR
ncbi:uncharacterized protein LOC109504226 isoform X2 [Harpegnathos saltator]|uniref:uncharacterized protein LOC109504226 isoform X2 n=1 Tax=Harpegnathos saltator TaxID=610380 RepID=UPI000948D4E7|nr:uncharacterized protein LOC109504226 isoform X2 [Harpegnathos saltator]